MKAIQVTFLPATNTRPSRLKAMADGVKPLVMGKDEAEEASGTSSQWNPEATSRHVAEALANRHDWGGDLLGGQIPGGDWVFVFRNQP